MSLVDASIVMQHVVTLLETIDNTKLKVVYPGEKQPSNTPLPFARLVAIDIDPDALGRQHQPRTGTNEPHHAHVVVTMNVYVPAALMSNSPAALTTALMRVAAALSQTHAQTSDGNQQLSLDQARTQTDPPDDDQQEHATGAVIVTGTATRLSGSTVTAFGE